MLLRMAGGTSAAHVAALYEGLLDALVVDEADAGEAARSVELVPAPILMRDGDAERELARRVLEVACG